MPQNDSKLQQVALPGLTKVFIFFSFLLQRKYCLNERKELKDVRRRGGTNMFGVKLRL